MPLRCIRATPLVPFRWWAKAHPTRRATRVVSAVGQGPPCAVGFKPRRRAGSSPPWAHRCVFPQARWARQMAGKSGSQVHLGPHAPFRWWAHPAQLDSSRVVGRAQARRWRVDAFSRKHAGCSRWRASRVRRFISSRARLSDGGPGPTLCASRPDHFDNSCLTEESIQELLGRSPIRVKCHLGAIYGFSARNSLGDEVKLPKYAPVVSPPMNKNRDAKQEKYRTNER